MRHNLKIERRWLDEVASGQKKAEIRKADRDFSAGDELLLYTEDRQDGEIVRVTHILQLTDVPDYDGRPFVVLSMEPLRRLQGETLRAELAKGSYGYATGPVGR